MSTKVGTYFESRVLKKLQTVWPKAERRGKQGRNDKGDYINVEPFVIEAKNRKAITLAEFMEETERERVNAGARWGACIINRKNHVLGDSYVVMELDAWLELVYEYMEGRL
jgi:hypothetical protein